jgi:cytochrome d ubiquinol oxidase subunit I
MIPSPEVVELSRMQFAITALYHFLFVPLTLGLSWLLVIMETCYVITGKQIYRDMTKFWGKLFGINFAMGVITGLTLEFQFGQNWAYFSQYIGNVFGLPLAIEGMVAFMLESVFVGIFFFGWDRVGKVTHLWATTFLAIGSNLSALVILVANGWMQNPIGATFNYQTMRMDLYSFSQLWLNPDAQVRFVHTLAAGYVTASLFVLGISAFYLLKGRDLAFAKRSFVIASGFGLAAVLSVIYLGDATGVEVATDQKAKLAAMEGEWTTEPAPAPWKLFALPDQAAQKNYAEIQIPWVMGLIVTHSLDTEVPGLKEIIAENKVRIEKGMTAYQLLQELRNGNNNPAVKAHFDQVKNDLGYGLLLKRFTPTITNATPAQVQAAANASIPPVATTFWSFRIMVALGLWMLLIFICANVFWLRGTWNKRWFLRICLYSIPVPWIASEFGWIVAEVGRQPWVVNGILPTFLGSSSLSVGQVHFSLAGFFLFYTTLFIVELYLMFKYARLGPSALHSGRYYFERNNNTKGAA